MASPPLWCVLSVVLSVDTLSLDVPASTAAPSQHAETALHICYIAIVSPGPVPDNPARELVAKISHSVPLRQDAASVPPRTAGDVRKASLAQVSKARFRGEKGRCDACGKSAPAQGALPARPPRKSRTAGLCARTSAAAMHHINLARAEVCLRASITVPQQ